MEAKGGAVKRGRTGQTAAVTGELENLAGHYKAMMSSDWRERREALGKCIDTVLKVGGGRGCGAREGSYLKAHPVARTCGPTLVSH